MSNLILPDDYDPGEHAPDLAPPKHRHWYGPTPKELLPKPTMTLEQLEEILKQVDARADAYVKWRKEHE